MNTEQQIMALSHDYVVAIERRDFALIASTKAALELGIAELIAELEKVTIERDHARDVCDSYVAELAALKSQKPAWKENELESMFGMQHKAYYLAAGAQAVPAGYQLVPIEPTEAMCKAADDSDAEYSLRNFGPGVHAQQSGYDHYCAMLAAAPVQAGAQPVQQEPDKCWCDATGTGEPGVTCGDCPRDYKAAPVQPYSGSSTAQVDPFVPAQEQRKPLPIERLREIERCHVYSQTATLVDFARAIEAAHNIQEQP